MRTKSGHQRSIGQPSLHKAKRKKVHKSSRTHAVDYEYTPSTPHRREKVTLDLSKEEKAGRYSNDDDDDDLSKMKTRLIKLVRDQDATIGSDEDEEIESDDAFEGDDEERFAEFSFGHSVRCVVNVFDSAEQVLITREGNISTMMIMRKKTRIVIILGQLALRRTMQSFTTSLTS